MTSTGAVDASASQPRWNGRRGRMEVWYATCTEEDGTGWWFHYETVAPVDESEAPFAHGWVACFARDAAPILERFGPDLIAGTSQAEALVSVDGCHIGQTAIAGRAGRLAWDLELVSSAAPLYTFPQWAWEREVLPGAQILDRPSATISGRVEIDGREREVNASGARAHIYSHGSAKRWAWLHCELGGTDVLEVVAAVSHMPVLDRLAPLPFVRIRVGGRDRPRDPLRAAIGARAQVGMPAWRLRAGLGGRRRLRVAVEMPAERCVQLQYPNPDGTSAYCANSERADARVVVEQRVGGRWNVDREWRLEATAHAEVGACEPWPGVDVSPFTAR
ncbi:MAG: hypothetical protein K1X95_04020 [Acidimicrobiia bacterium]|nr:hypothetical protein [Acidimicrobiia bacterium]